MAVVAVMAGIERMALSLALKKKRGIAPQLFQLNFRIT
jgi:hypothetical protein